MLQYGLFFLHTLTSRLCVFARNLELSEFGGIWSFCVLVAKNYSHKISNIAKRSQKLKFKQSLSQIKELEFGGIWSFCVLVAKNFSRKISNIAKRSQKLKFKQSLIADKKEVSAILTQRIKPP
jgi:hypothetical protein